VPTQGEAIIQNDSSTIWRVETAQPDGFHLIEKAFGGHKDLSASYMSFYLNSPRRLDDLLTEPNVPKLYLNLETACCLRVWLNGKEILTQANVFAQPVSLQVPLLLQKGNNHILLKVVNRVTDDFVKAFLSSSHTDFIEKLVGTVELN
jgi:hypothetical protein